MTVHSDGADILSSMSVSLGTNTSKFSAAVDRANRIYVEGQVRNGTPFITKIGNFDLELSVQVSCFCLIIEIAPTGLIRAQVTLHAPKTPPSRVASCLHDKWISLESWQGYQLCWPRMSATLAL